MGLALHPDFPVKQYIYAMHTYRKFSGLYNRVLRLKDRGSTGIFGRIRDVVEGPDGALYFLMNNTDGRGDPRPGDDKIFRIIPK
jgi:hypothetical protein